LSALESGIRFRDLVLFTFEDKKNQDMIS
jgi:hypothetical protein